MAGERTITTREFIPPIIESIKIQPEIETVTLEDGMSFSTLILRVSCGNDWGFQGVADPVHEGPMEGAAWEQTKAYWLHHCRFVQENIGDMIVRAAAQLCDEGIYAGRTDIDFNKLFSTSADLARYHKAQPTHTVTDQGGIKFQAPTPYDSPYQSWVAEWAFHITQRIAGQAELHIGSKRVLRYSKQDLERMASLYPQEHKKARNARSIQIAHGGAAAWREEAKADWPELTVEVMQWFEKKKNKGGASAYRWEPSQIAFVLCARACGLRMLDKTQWFKIPDADQWRTIKREFDEAMKMFAEAQRLGLKW